MGNTSEENQEINKCEWKVDVDMTVINMLVNPLQFDVFNIIANKDGTNTEEQIGKVSDLDLSQFVFGETEFTFTNNIKSSTDEEIGTVTCICSLSNPLFNDEEIDFHNHITVKLIQMINIPNEWID